ncbi:MAG: 50S ribosomal protein L35 [Candidatus Omnitrophica bacterium]|nr:50S ribosomal protein L35 [Candidatus Omnitrophota bacterium]
MAKLKTKKGVAKRFRLTKTGKIKYMPAGKSHLLTGKKASRLRKMRRARCIEVDKARHYIKRMLPYG